MLIGWTNCAPNCALTLAYPRQTLVTYGETPREMFPDVESATGKGVLYRSLRSAHSAAASEPANTVTPERLQDLLRRSSMR
jgi:hypothetical protein